MVCQKCRREVPEGRFCALCGADQLRHQKRRALRRPNGAGTVYKLQGRRKRPWVAAKDKIIIGYYETRTAALDAVNKLAGVDITDRYNMTFAQVFDLWKAEHYKDLTSAGIETYDRAYDVFADLHGKKFRSLRTADYQAIIDQHKSKSYSTVSKYKQLLTQMSKWAQREEIITTSFANYVTLKEDPKKEKEIFTPAEIRKLEADGSEAARIVLMLLSTGMRIGELFALPLADYHETHVVGGEKTDAGKNRVIPIRPEGRPHFAYFAQCATGDLLLSGYKGNRSVRNFRRRDYYELLDRLKIQRKTPHATRHTYISRAVKEGMRPEILQRIVGHSDYSTTANVYTHIDQATLIAAVDPASNELVTQTHS